MRVAETVDRTTATGNHLNRSQTLSRTAAPGEVIYSEGYAGDRLLFVIADGKIEISTRCEESAS